jgi:ATP synthase in type III secretion protein N
MTADHQASLERLVGKVAALTVRRRYGKLTEVDGTCVKAAMAGVVRGAVFTVRKADGAMVRAEVIGVRGNLAILTPFGATEGLAEGALLVPAPSALTIAAGEGLLGRVVDVFGQPIDGRGDLRGATSPSDIRRSAPAPMARPMIDAAMTTGLRAIDGPLALGLGQRVGIFGPPGVGKSRLIASIAAQSQVDVIVIGLVGERGREVREFIDRDLPQAARKRVVIVAATSDRPAVERALCAQSATAVAEAFRDQGRDVLLLVDSLTRTARALREIGLAAGEPPTRRGYTASVYPALPAIIERAGLTETGSITALYTVLLEGDGEGDPIAEEVRSLTDGHIVLSRKLAEAAHFPAIDVVESLSRCMPAVVGTQHMADAEQLRRLLAKYREIELLLQVGEYSPGGDPLADHAVRAKPAIDAFLKQAANDIAQPGTCQRQLREAIR